VISGNAVPVKNHTSLCFVAYFLARRICKSPIKTAFGTRHGSCDKWYPEIILETYSITNLRRFFMSPRFYAFLWALTGATALGLWIAGAFTMLTLVVFGFVAFTLVFTGMMCVLPGEVGHSHEGREPVAAKPLAMSKPVDVQKSSIPAGAVQARLA
jgi:hypothetical protein